MPGMKDEGKVWALAGGAVALGAIAYALFGRKKPVVTPAPPAATPAGYEGFPAVQGEPGKADEHGRLVGLWTFQNVDPRWTSVKVGGAVPPGSKFYPVSYGLDFGIFDGQYLYGYDSGQQIMAPPVTFQGWYTFGLDRAGVKAAEDQGVALAKAAAGPANDRSAGGLDFAVWLYDAKYGWVGRVYSDFEPRLVSIDGSLWNINTDGTYTPI
jgi:hypothetical protein